MLGQTAEWVLAGVCLLLLGLAALCAVRMPPHNIDAMVYHLPRQLRWLQQGILHAYLFYILAVVVAALTWVSLRTWAGP